MPPTPTAVSRGAVLGRVIRPERGDLPAAAARSLLKLSFEEADLARMHELAAKGQEGRLGPEEQAEIAEFRQVGLLLDLLKSKARLSLKKLGRGGE